MRLNEQAQSSLDNRFFRGQSTGAHHFAHQRVVDIDGCPHHSKFDSLNISAKSAPTMNCHPERSDGSVRRGKMRIHPSSFFITFAL
jgi:hypothetical protein